MQYYYSSHIRNLEDEAYLQKQKISAQLHESNLIKQQEHLSSSRNSTAGHRSRREQDKETAAFLERSRLEAELSAARAKAENSMNRSRLESAFQIRKENQKAFEELSQLDFKHEELTRRAAREEITAHNKYLESTEQVEARLRQEDRLYQIHHEEQLRAEEIERTYRNAILGRSPYWPYYR